MFQHDFPFDPTGGYDRARLEAVQPVPPVADFSDFWQNTRRAAAQIDPAPELRPSAQRVPGHDVQDVSFTSWGGVRLHGWLSRPINRPVNRGLVVSHGYGGRLAPDPFPLLDDAAIIYPCSRGLGASARPDERDLPPHVLRGIGHRDTYIFRGCAADVWAAATTLQHVVPEAAGRLDYIGTSFGGGIGALALPWDERFRAAFLGVPSFGQHPLRLRLPCSGSGEAVRLYAQTHPEIVDVLAYYDASAATRFMNRPTLVELALFDPAVPPAGQFAVFNGLAGAKQSFVRQAGHFEYPAGAAEDTALTKAIRQFLRAM